MGILEMFENKAKKYNIRKQNVQKVENVEIV